MEFKGKQRAEEYASEKSSSPVFKENHIKDYLSGYNQALEDSKSNEMLEMLEESTEVIKWYMENSTSELSEPFFNIGANQIEQTEQLIKQATEL